MTWLIDKPGLKSFWLENQWEFPRWYDFSIIKMWSNARCCFLFLVSSNESTLLRKLQFPLVSTKRKKEAYSTLRCVWKKEKRESIFSTPVCLPGSLFKYLISFDISSTSEDFAFFQHYLDIRHSNIIKTKLNLECMDCNVLYGRVMCRVLKLIEYWWACANITLKPIQLK